MEKYKNIIGKYGEDASVQHLQNDGYRIINRNYNCQFGEIDIIALDGECLVFVEVKTRTTDRYGSPENAINYWKKKHLQLTARNYIEHKRVGNFIARFDIVEVFAKYADNNFVVEKINVIKNAF